MRVGEMLWLKPTFDTTYGMMDEVTPLPAEVVYIHPQQRFYTVRFTAAGGSWTETFSCTPCELDMRGRKKHENDCNYEQQGRRRKNRDRNQSGRYTRA